MFVIIMVYVQNTCRLLVDKKDIQTMKSLSTTHLKYSVLWDITSPQLPPEKVGWLSRIRSTVKLRYNVFLGT